MADALLGVLKLIEVVIDGLGSLIGRVRGSQETDEETASETGDTDG